MEEEEEIGECTECGKLFEIKGKKPSKYCKNCAIKVDDLKRNNRKR